MCSTAAVCCNVIGFYSSAAKKKQFYTETFATYHLLVDKVSAVDTEQTRASSLSAELKDSSDEAAAAAAVMC